MRICYVTHSNSHFTAPYVDYFAARGHEIHVISFHPNDLPNAVVHHPAGGAFDPEKHKWRYLWNARKVVRLIQRIKPDILHAHYVTSNGALAAASGVHPLVVSARGSDVHTRVRGWFARRLIVYVLQHADLMNPVSRELEEKILDLGCPRGRVLRLTQGIVVRNFLVDRSRRKPGPIRIICTRPLSSKYQCDRIARALVVLAHLRTDWEFTFAATGPREGVLRQRIDRAGLADHVRFLGGFTQAALPALLADSDIYVSASLSDGTSPALLEAMTSGAFPVVSDIPANREWLTGQGDSLFFSPHNLPQLVQCLMQAIDDGSLRRRAIEMNPPRVQEKGDRETNLSVLAQTYGRLVERRH